MSLALLATLAVLTWQQSRMYADIETLYRTTIARNPDCSMAHNNLAAILERRGEIREASEHYQRAVELRPDNAEAHNSLATLLGAVRTWRRGDRTVPTGPGDQAPLRPVPLQPGDGSDATRTDR